MSPHGLELARSVEEVEIRNAVLADCQSDLERTVEDMRERHRNNELTFEKARCDDLMALESEIGRHPS